MSAGREWGRRVAGWWRGADTGRLDEEVAHHLEMLAADYEARGMAPAAAREAARREIGNVTTMREEFREQSGVPLLEETARNLRYALRTIGRSPGYAAAAMGTIGLGVGAMVTVLAVVSALFWRPLPFPAPDRLVALREVDPRQGDWVFSEPDLLDVQVQARSLDLVAGYRSGAVAMTGAGDPETIEAAAVTPTVFPLLGVKMLAGAGLGDRLQEVVIGRALWERKWQSSPSAIGRTVAIGGVPHTVTGVAELPGELLPGVELLLPLRAQPTESRSSHEIVAMGRLAPGVALGQAQAELSAIAQRVADANPRTNAGWGLRALPLREQLLGPAASRTVWMIFGAVALLWLLACANVAGLQMARQMARRQETSTRQMLGAGRLRLLAQAATESLMLGLGGAAAGMLLAAFGTQAIRGWGAPSLPALAGVRMDLWTVGVALGCVTLSMIACTLVAGRPERYQTVRAVSRRDRGRDALIVAQVALASVLLLGAGLLVQSFLRLRGVDPGFRAENLTAVPVSLGAGDFDSVRRVAFFREASERLAALPGVEGVGASNVAPFGGQGTANRFRREWEPDTVFHSAAWRAVTPGFFAAVGLPLRRGRLFTERDGNGAEEVVLINETMARQFWPDRDPVGQRLRWGRSGSLKTIVGVVGDLRDLTLDAPAPPMMFRPFAQLTDAPMSLLIRTAPGRELPAASVRGAIWSVFREAAVEIRPVGESLQDSLLRPRASATAFGVFALLALLTAACGLYGLIAYRVQQRRQEIGIRLALGCPGAAVRRSILARSLALTGWGVAMGLAVSWVLAQGMASLLYETRPNEAAAYAAVAAVFLAVAVAASDGPARRAARLDPAIAIRHE